MNNDNNLPPGRIGLSDKRRENKRGLWHWFRNILDWDDLLASAVGRDGIIFSMMTAVGGAAFSCALVMFAFIMVIIAAVQLYKMLW